MGGVADPKIHAPPLRVIMSNLVDLRQSRVNRRNPQNGERWCPAPLCWGRGWPLNKPPSHMCYRVKFGSSATKGVRINRKNTLGKRWDLTPWGGAWLTPKTSPLHTYYHFKFGSSALKGVYINRREPSKLWSAGAPPACGRGVADPLEIHSSPTCYPAEFCRSIGPKVGALLRSAWKFDPSVPPFKVIVTDDTYRSLFQLWLPINDPQQPRTYLVPFPW